MALGPWRIVDIRLLGCFRPLWLLTLLPLRPLVAPSRRSRLLDWLLVHVFISVFTVVTVVAFTVGLFTFVTELDWLAADLFALAVVERVFHELRIATHENSTRR